MTMAERIRMLRLQKNLTQEELGKVLGVQKSAIRKYESGMVENIPRSSIKKMADVFGVAPSYLMGWEENSPEQTELSEGEKIWLTLYKSLSEETRELLITTVNALEQLPEESRKIYLSMLRGALGSQAEEHKR